MAFSNTPLQSTIYIYCFLELLLMFLTLSCDVFALSAAHPSGVVTVKMTPSFIWIYPDLGQAHVSTPMWLQWPTELGIHRQFPSRDSQLESVELQRSNEFGGVYDGKKKKKNWMVWTAIAFEWKCHWIGHQSFIIGHSYSLMIIPNIPT